MAFSFAFHPTLWELEYRGYTALLAQTSYVPTYMNQIAPLANSVQTQNGYSCAPFLKAKENPLHRGLSFVLD